MSDSPLSPDIAEMIAMIDGLDEAPQSDNIPVRFVVATDWTDGAVPLSLLKAFRVIFRPDQDVQLVFAVPHEPTAEDAACVEVLLEGAGATGDLRGLELMSFDRVVEEEYDSALVPDGDTASLITQVAGVITRMHDVARRLEAQGSSSDVSQGNGAALRSRLSAMTTGS